eukprot:TRINITY_DN55254_c0_g1_i1.p1 TRINITY_DN55254_c0_g1~~TRINITY_DN55254_c0_g1_i1.p1  ORF type:complete len:293 (+),score=111.73 TRINITY_DN55254_c0_g1_i1:82-879(+)
MRKLVVGAVVAAVLAAGWCIVIRAAAGDPPPGWIPPRIRKLQGGRRAVVLGGTGATGSKLLQQLIESDEWAAVTALYQKGRRPPDGGGSSKVTLVEVDFDQPLPPKPFIGHDTVFNCLGTTRSAAGTGARFRQIEVAYSMNAATAAKSAGVLHFSVVSAQGADASAYGPEWIHPMLYRKVLGEKERAATDLGFWRVSIFRPGMLDRERGDRFLETLVLRSNLPALRVSDLAAAMIIDAESEPPTGQEPPVYYEGNGMIRKLSRRG